ncbi:TPA: ribonucleoside-diphosphate reductase subunit alpha [Salmonella enterica]|nr:ribonucleoside-diphosphate reductase subunit alpha [Salmonella enterica]HCH9607930.1 ribonucleoside-diphosphate reductase subunit alpha [Salmonella enterica]HDI5000224.1 ribonucleoside-diphosphate reductase subunit alpha [Salmonella enterica]HDI5005045.1 ribonucleoside-diphosphate reductase subunit alpha [Salmonella enterica]
MKVVKRSGKYEQYNCKKIKKAIMFACDGLKVNPLELEAKFDEFLFDGVTTKAIQDNLIHHAKNLASPLNDAWLLVAGRLATMNRWNDTRAYELSFLDYFKKQKATGEWSHEKFDVYSEEDIVKIGTFLKKENDLQHTIASVETAESKYLGKNECIQHILLGNAMLYASVEEESSRLYWVEHFYNYLSSLEWSLASSQLMNMRKGLNNASCFIIAPDDDINSIYDAFKDVAKISKSGGGLGFFAGLIRAKGSKLMGQDDASGGVVPMLKVFNDTLVYVNQAGKRKGAGTVALPIWHNDILDFLDIQTEVGDPRSKCFDIQPQVTVFDLFMKKLEEDKTQTWLTFCPHEVKEVLGINIGYLFNEEFEEAYSEIEKAYAEGKLKVVTEHVVNDLWKHLLMVFFERGRPYPIFIDKINRDNPNKHDGVIFCVNLCIESFSNTLPDYYAHTCSLASLVVGRIPVNKLSDSASDLTRLLSNGMEITTAPIEQSLNHMRDYRTIGIGIQGMADILAREGRTYEDLDFITEVAERIQFGFVRESIKLAKERGAYPKFKGSRWDVGDIFDEYHKNSVCPDLDWLELKRLCKLHGIYSSQGTSPAPNTSTSLFMMAAAGFMPHYAEYFYEDNKDGKTPVSSMYLNENPIFYSFSIGYFKQYELTKAVGAAQKFVDTGISAEYVVDRNIHDITALDIDKLVRGAWFNGNKGVYYLRTVKKGESLVKTNDVCSACSG